MNNNLNKQTRAIIGESLSEILDIVAICDKKVNRVSKAASILYIATAINSILILYILIR